MFWIILKIALFLAVVAGATLTLDLLLGMDGGIRIAVADVELTLGPLQAALVALVALAGLWLLMKLAGLVVAVVRFINGDETAVSRYFEAARKRRGLEALTEGFLALAAGEGEQAVAKGRKAEKLLENRTLTNLLIAQAAQSKGNTQLAEDYYRRLLADDRGRFAGVQGLLQQKIAAGDGEKARRLAEKALAIRPGHGQTQDTLLGLQNQAADWQGARATLLEAKRSGRLPRDVYRRRDAVLALQLAADRAAAQDDAAAQDLALEAVGNAPLLVPAAVMGARAQIARGRRRAAVNIVKRAWKESPHPDLARVFAEIAADETPTERIRRFESLLSLVDDDETRLTRAELFIAAEDFPAARRAMGDVATRAPSQRAMALMAAIERGEGSPEAVVRGWLARALTAPRGPAWVCDKCQHVHGQWAALCAGCGAFDTLSWRDLPETGGTGLAGTEMLPLIVGALSRPDAAPAETEDPVESDGQADDSPQTAPRDVTPPDPDTDPDTSGQTADPAEPPTPDEVLRRSAG